MKKFFSEFKTFISRGNVVDMAVGVIVGGAFGKISTSLVNDVIMPAVSMLMGGVDFTAWKVVLKEAVMEMGADGVLVETAPEVAIKYGSLIAVIVDFLIIALSVFCMVKLINTMKEKAEALKKKEEEEAAAEAPAEPEPSAEEKLLTEIRDLLKNK
ncbi:MAG: large-conductance mechanosensitive channel protein MscL [Clostridia bacterium]|nr:large-conductance mechanosensitive channel protein MscL [Clostridia bacterium]